MALDSWPLLMDLRKRDKHGNVIMAAIVNLQGVRQVRKFYAEYSDYISRIRQYAGVADWKDLAVIDGNIVWSIERVGDRAKAALWLRALPCLTGGNDGGKVRASTEEKS